MIPEILFFTIFIGGLSKNIRSQDAQGKSLSLPPDCSLVVPSWKALMLATDPFHKVNIMNS